MGQKWVRYQEVKHHWRLHLDSIASHVRLHSVVYAQQACPLSFLMVAVLDVQSYLGQEQGDSKLRALYEASKLHESPAQVAVHRGVCRAHEGVYLRGRLGVEALRGSSPYVIDVQLLDAKVGKVEANPHFAADEVTHIASVLPTAGEAAPD